MLPTKQARTSVVAFFFCISLNALIAGEQLDKREQAVLGVQLSRELMMNGVQVPLYDANSRLEARLRMDSVSLDARKVGFFRIGILPQVVVHNVDLTIYANESDAVWPSKLCDLFLSESPLADADLLDLNITTIPRCSVSWAPQCTLRIEKPKASKRECRTQYCDLFLTEENWRNSDPQDIDTHMPCLHTVHVSAKKGHFHRQDHCLVLNDVTIEKCDGTLSKTDSASLILEGADSGRLFWTGDGKQQCIEMKTPLTAQQ